MGAAGAVGGATYVDDVFSSYLWKGDGNSGRTITNNIDVSGEGALVWMKSRNTGNVHVLFDTERGANQRLRSDSNLGQNNTDTLQPSFTSSGFTVGSGNEVNGSGNYYSSWTFRKAPGFFDIVTWTGNGTANRKISHSLDSVPGAIWIKRLTGSTGTNVSDWICYHRKSNGGSYPWNYLDYLNRDIWPSNDASGNYLYNVAPAADEFTIGSHETVNNNGDSYVAYIFAHNDQRFGENIDKEIIKCDSYTGDGSTSNEINLGWEPQWVLVKNAKVGAGGGSGGNWIQWDNMRGVVTSGNDEYFSLNNNSAESAFESIEFTPTGFILKSSSSFINSNSKPYIFIAIRRSDGYVGKPADAGTDVLAMDTGSGSSTIPNFDSGFPVDFTFMKKPASSSNWFTYARLTQKFELVLNTDSAQGGASDYTFDSNVGWGKGGDSSDWQSWMWKRHAGFDVVTYNGTGNNQTISHSLNKVPEMMWSKGRTFSDWWGVYHKDIGTDKYLRLNTNGSEYSDSYIWQDTAPTSSVFYIGQNQAVNYSGNTHIMMLFASVDGISKVGSYTGTGGTGTITTGFQPRFLIYKKTSSTQDWFVLDTTRGWGSGDDKYLELNNDNDQDDFQFGAPTSTGFTVEDYNNTSGASFIYYAHA